MRTRRPRKIAEPTNREIQMLIAISQYGTIGAAAKALGLSRSTGDSTIDRLREKSGFHFLPQIVAWALTQGLMEMPQPVVTPGKVRRKTLEKVSLAEVAIEASVEKRPLRRKAS